MSLYSHSKSDHLSDVEEGEINDRAKSSKRIQSLSPATRTNDGEKRRSAHRQTSPTPGSPRKRNRYCDDDPFEEYERLSRRHQSRSRSRSRDARRYTDRYERRRRSSDRSRRSISPGKQRHYSRNSERRDQHHDARADARRRESSLEERRHIPRHRDEHALIVRQEREHPRRPSEGEKAPFRPHDSNKNGPSNAPTVAEKPKVDDDDDDAMETFDFRDEDEQKKEEERLIEERRRKRQAILEKHKSNLPASTPLKANATLDLTEVPMQKSSASVATSDAARNTTVGEKADTACQVVNNGSALTTEMTEKPGDSTPDAVSAADYDPSRDAVDDAVRRRRHHDEDMNSKDELLKSKDHQERVAPGVNGEADMSATDYTEQLEKPKPDMVMDMFAPELDMFAVHDTIPILETNTANIPDTLNTNPIDNIDDSEGYYNVRIGELLDNRYRVISTLGSGVFSSVVKAEDIETKTTVAVKLIRNNETMYKAGQKELGYLRKLMEADPDDKKHVIRLHNHFEHRKHLCLVFESLSMDLRKVLKKYGKDVGISIKAVSIYAQQLFCSLSLLKRCNILHADIKPDNILVSEKRNLLKLCDLGSASDASDNEITPYLVSRFYRAPEIILGLPYDYAIDVWSVACTLYELFTGKILFPGHSNNQMLKCMMEVKGRFPNKLLRKSKFVSQHFDADLSFMSIETDRLSKKEVAKKLVIVKPTRDIKSRIMAASTSYEGMNKEDEQLVAAFIDLLEKCLVISPDKRMTVKEALSHPFVTGKVPK